MMLHAQLNSGHEGEKIHCAALQLCGTIFWKQNRLLLMLHCNSANMCHLIEYHAVEKNRYIYGKKI